MIIIGVDPGTVLTGYGIISSERNSVACITNGTIKLKSSQSITDRLSIIYEELNNIIKQHKPDEFAIETAFFGKNVQSAMKIGYARGVSILSAVHEGIPVSEYSPREVKKSIVGTGAASKEQVNYMIRTLLNIKNKKMKFDESDALAVALCHAFRIKNPSKKKNNWKSFVENYPERVIK